MVVSRSAWLYLGLVLSILIAGEGDEPANIWFGALCIRCEEAKKDKGGILPR